MDYAPPSRLLWWFWVLYWLVAVLFVYAVVFFTSLKIDLILSYANLGVFVSCHRTLTNY